LLPSKLALRAPDPAGAPNGSISWRRKRNLYRLASIFLSFAELPQSPNLGEIQ
jgi:hypothetical protein